MEVKNYMTKALEETGAGCRAAPPFLICLATHTPSSALKECLSSVGSTHALTVGASC